MIRPSSIFLFILFIAGISLNSFSQHNHAHCASQYLDSLKKLKNERLIREQRLFERELQQNIANKRLKRMLRDGSVNEPILKIPVVVHIVHNNEFETIGGPLNPNISDEQIWTQIDVLNEDFRRNNADTVNTPSIFKDVAVDTRIEFCLASRDPSGNISSGITRHYNSQAEYNYNSEFDKNKLRAFGYWPSDQYLNIWVTTIKNSILGFAQFPSNAGLSGISANQGDEFSDGVVLHHKAFGTTGTVLRSGNPYRYGRTCTHEIGHWLGLYHTFTTSCTGTDYVSDTPTQESSSLGWDKCGDDKTSTCATRVMYENYMDYTDDICMNLFTQGQCDRMRAAMEVSPRRFALLSSKGCCGEEGSSVTIPYSYDFENNDFASDGWDTVSTQIDHFWDNASTGNESTGSVSLDNTVIGSSEDSSSLETPIIDFSTSESPCLEFDLAYASIGTTDKLILQYETTCSENWQTISSWSGESLRTSTSSDLPFEPTNQDWETIKVDLKELALLSVVKLRFVGVSSESNTIYIDNINIFKESNELQVLLFPNPSPGELEAEIIFNGEQDVEIQVFNPLGQMVHTSSYIEQNSNFFDLDLTRLSQGLYIVKVVVDGDMNTQSVVIDNY